MISIRGAITIINDNQEEIINSTKELLENIIAKNNVNIEDIISIIFSCTNDIKSAYPAQAAREIGIVNAGLMCLSEMEVQNSLKKCIRVLMLVNINGLQKNVKHVYLRGASILRPDLIDN